MCISKIIYYFCNVKKIIKNGIKNSRKKDLKIPQNNSRCPLVRLVHVVSVQSLLMSSNAPNRGEVGAQIIRGNMVQLYNIVTKNTLRTRKGKKIFLKKYLYMQL